MTNNHIRQEVNGNENLVAGRDINLKKHAPDINNPNMMKCYCGSVISRGADECPDCGHNHLRDRLIEFENKKVKTEKLKLSLVAIAAFNGSIALHISSNYQYTFINSFISMLIAEGLIWFGFQWLKITIQSKFN